MEFDKNNIHILNKNVFTVTRFVKQAENQFISNLIIFYMRCVYLTGLQ